MLKLMTSLLVDIGNTDTCAGIAEDAEIVDSTRAVSSVSACDFLAGAPEFTPESAIISSVVSSKTAEWTAAIKEKWGIDAIVLTPDVVKDLIAFNVEDPTKVGADRIADAVGLKVFYGAPAIVVDFGTATNIEYVDENGTFEGGIIMTGVWSGMKSLSEFASALQDVRLEVPEHVIGKTTENSVQSGLLFGEAARVDGLVTRIKASLPSGVRRCVKVIATGGFCNLVAPLCETVDFADSLLTLKGLNFILNNVSC